MNGKKSDKAQSAIDSSYASAIQSVSPISHDLLKTLSEQVPGVIYQYKLRSDGTACFPYASDGIQKVYEVSPEQVFQDASIVMSRIHPDDFDMVVKSITDSAQTMSVWSCDYRVILPKTGLRWLAGHATPQKIPDGSVLWHGFITDVTQRYETEARLAVAAKMSTLGEMAAGIAHEINNPLAVILGKTEQLRTGLRKQTLSPEMMMGHLDKIAETTQRIAKIVKNLKSFSRTTDDEQPEVIALSKLVGDSLELCTEKLRSHGVQLILPSFEDFEIECLTVQITQVIMNLVNNAFDAIKGREEKWIKVSVEKRDSNAVISVTDSGGGIPENLISQIMNPFFTTKPSGEGTGLGLSIAQRIVAKHGGYLRCLSGTQNTTFEIQLPIKKSASL